MISFHSDELVSLAPRAASTWSPALILLLRSADLPLGRASVTALFPWKIQWHWPLGGPSLGPLCPACPGHVAPGLCSPGSPASLPVSRAPASPALREAAQLFLHFVADLELQGQGLRGNSIHTHVLSSPWILPPSEACASREISCLCLLSKIKKNLFFRN